MNCLSESCAGGPDEEVDGLTQGVSIVTVDENEGDTAVEALYIPGCINQISETLYFNLLLATPPKILASCYFAIGPGSGPFKLVWERDGRYFSRQLTAGESSEFFRRVQTKKWLKAPLTAPSS